MNSIFQDIRFASRQLRKSPGFALTAVAVLALGLGANITVFTLLSGIFLRPLPYVHAERIVAINGPTTNGFSVDLSFANLQPVKRWARVYGKDRRLDESVNGQHHWPRRPAPGANDGDDGRTSRRARRAAGTWPRFRARTKTIQAAAMC